MSDSGSNGEKEPTVVRAEKFELVGPDGEVRATLGFSPNPPKDGLGDSP